MYILYVCVCVGWFCIPKEMNYKETYLRADLEITHRGSGNKEVFSGCSVQLWAAAAQTMLPRQGGLSLKPLICWENNGNTPLAMLGTWEPFHCTVCGSIRQGCWEFLLSEQLNNLTILGLALFSIALRLLCKTGYEVTRWWKSPQTVPEGNEWL